MQSPRNPLDCRTSETTETSDPIPREVEPSRCTHPAVGLGTVRLAIEGLVKVTERLIFKVISIIIKAVTNLKYIYYYNFLIKK